MPQSWRQFLDQPAAVESDVAPGENHGSPENIPASYSIFLFDNASFKKKTRGSLKACTTSAFSAAWHQQAQSQIRFYKRFGSLMYIYGLQVDGQHIIKVVWLKLCLLSLMSHRDIVASNRPGLVELGQCIHWRQVNWILRMANAKRVYIFVALR